MINLVEKLANEEVDLMRRSARRMSMVMAKSISKSTLLIYEPVWTPPLRTPADSSWANRTELRTCVDPAAEDP